MSSVPPQWQRITLPWQRQAIKVLTSKKARQFLTRAIACALILTMMAWNWKLVFSTLAGVGLMGLVYQLQDWNWRAFWQSWRPLLSKSQGKLMIAVGSGSLVSLGTYIAASIWADSENRWLAIGSILQGIGTLLTLALLGGHLLTHRDKRNEETIERWLEKLTASNPLDRLMAVKRLGELELPYQRREQIRDFFRYLLSQETDPTIRSALLEHFQPGTDTPAQKLLQIPLQIKSISKRVYHP